MARFRPISRRAALKGAGVTLALPWMEAMMVEGKAAARVASPKRFCAIQFPFGVAMPKDGTPDRPWGWFPMGEGGKGKPVELSNPLRPLEPVLDDVTIFSGLSHPRCRTMNGHDTGDIFLTANNLAKVTYRNTISLDQHIAGKIGEQTRHASLTLSTDGGVGPRTRTTTLSYNADGQPIPALADPKLIFQRLFAQDKASRDDMKKLESSGSILDLVMDQSRSLRSQIGRADQQKLDEYETSVREVEQRVERARDWVNVPLPEVDADSLTLEVTPESPKEYLTAIYDLLYLSFQTDLTRVATYQVGSMGPSRARNFPQSIDIKGDWHSLAHGAGKKGGAEKMGRFDEFMTAQLVRFLTRLRDTQEGDSNLLDTTQVLYGSSNSKTHVNRNFPLLLAGGSKLGHQHGSYLRFSEKVPMSNLFVSILQAMGLEDESFVDSTGPLEGLS
ncbi:MAG: DUF1552 domain-containing protein [Verrucomicrobiales bacterium]